MNGYKREPHGFCETPKENCTLNFCDENGCQNRKRILAEEPEREIFLMNANTIIDTRVPKQETLLEEAAEKRYPIKLSLPLNLAFKDGYKLALERMYSEEEVIKLLKNFAPHIIYNAENLPLTWSEVVKEWFEQFKKK